MFTKKKAQNLKSSYLYYFKEKKSWNLICKFEYGFSVASCKKKKKTTQFLISRKKGILYFLVILGELLKCL